MRNYLVQLFLLLAVMLGNGVPSGFAADTGEQHSSVQVLEQFNQDADALAPERAISTQRKHEILFWMGGALLLLILLAAGFGVAMGIFEKDVFVWHVLSAGLATTLAIAHAVVAFVWFYPD